MDNGYIKQQLNGLAEPDYQRFSSRLIPNIASESVLGVRLPALRRIAKQIAKEEWRHYLENALEDSFEEVLLQGMVIGYIKADFEEKMAYVAKFIPKIDNWSTCDSFCAGLKIAKEYPDKVWDFIVPYLSAENDYEIRFGVVMLIYYYTADQYMDEALARLDAIQSKSYYVQMAVAWAVSIYYTANPERTMLYLNANHLDDFTYNKALQKITESLKVTKEEKTMIRQMKRR